MIMPSQSTPAHVPVLLNEAVRALDLKSGDTVVDCTVGGGSHAQRILEETSPNGRLLGIDRDSDALRIAQKKLERFHGRYTLVHDNFRSLDDILRREMIDKVDGILMDLGVSSFQLESASRGFSFQVKAPLDMRMDTTQKLTADQIIAKWSAEDLATLLREYADVENARSVARAIVKERSAGPIQDTVRLVEIIKKAGGARKKKIHPATLVFQAIRIAVNDELGALREVLPKAVRHLKIHGRMCVISFHSLEDREVKRFFQRCAKSCNCPPRMPVCRCGGKAIVKLVIRKPIRPSEAEIAANPRSRSAKMRVAEKVCEPSGE